MIPGDDYDGFFSLDRRTTAAGGPERGCTGALFVMLGMVIAVLSVIAGIGGLS